MESVGRLTDVSLLSCFSSSLTQTAWMND